MDCRPLAAVHTRLLFSYNFCSKNLDLSIFSIVWYTHHEYVCLLRSTAFRRKAFEMALRSDELHYNLQHLNGMLTTHEAAKQLDLSYWHFMHLVEAGRIPGMRIVDRWLFSPIDLAAYRRSKYGELEDMAKLALEHPAVDLTEKQATICR